MNDDRMSISGHRAMIAVLVVLFLTSLAYLSFGNIMGGAEPWQILANVLILSIPLGLLYFSIGLLVIFWRQRRSQGVVNTRVVRFIYLAPRFAGVLIILFISLFALDVFDMPGTVWEKMLAFIMHSLPAIILAVLLALAWRWEWVGFLAFLAAAVFFLVFFFSDLQQMISMLLLFSGPMSSIALMFLAGWNLRKSRVNPYERKP